MSSPLNGFLDPSNDFFELTGQLSSSTTEHSLTIHVAITGVFDDFDDDGVPDFRDNCPARAQRWSDEQQRFCIRRAYGDACAIERILSMDHPADWSAPGVTMTAGTPSVDPGTALVVEGDGYIPITAAPFSTSDYQRLFGAPTDPTRLVVYVRVPSDQPNPYWIGAVQAYISAPSANLHDVYLGQVELTEFPVGSFWKASYELPSGVLAMLAGAHDDVELRFSLNVNQGVALLPRRGDLRKRPGGSPIAGGSVRLPTRARTAQRMPGGTRHGFRRRRLDRERRQHPTCERGEQRLQRARVLWGRLRRAGESAAGVRRTARGPAGDWTGYIAAGRDTRDAAAGPVLDRSRATLHQRTRRGIAQCLPRPG